MSELSSAKLAFLWEGSARSFPWSPLFKCSWSSLLRLLIRWFSPSHSFPSGTPSVLRQTIAAACSASFFDLSLKSKQTAQVKVETKVSTLSKQLLSCMTQHHEINSIYKYFTAEDNNRAAPEVIWILLGVNVDLLLLIGTVASQTLHFRGQCMFGPSSCNPQISWLLQIWSLNKTKFWIITLRHSGPNIISSRCVSSLILT